MKRKTIKLLLGVAMTTLFISGCSPKIETKNYTHEAGEVLPDNIETYATFPNSELAKEATIDLSKVDENQVGIHEATISLKGKTYSVEIEVVDTKAPEGTFETTTIAVGIDGKVTPDLFGISCIDASNITYGFRNQEFLKTEEELRTLIEENLAKAREEEIEEIALKDLVGITWEEDQDSWDENGVSEESITLEFVPEKSGLYKLELASRDDYGNTDFINCYVIADLEAPVLKAEDQQFTVTNDFDKYMDSMSQGIYAEDNLLGDITSSIEVIDSKIDDQSKDAARMMVSYEVYDLAGNNAKGERTITAKAEVKVIKQQAGESYLEGIDRSRAEEAFALVNQQRVAAGFRELSWDESVYNIAVDRAQEIVSSYSHIRPSTGTSTVEEYSLGENLNKLWGDTSAGAAVSSWMNSQGHKDNLLTGYYTRSAVACYQSGKYCYYVQLFGF